MNQENKLPASYSLLPEYVRYNLPVQQQQADNCWAYSIVSCMELELSRARKQTVTLSGPYLTWAAAKADPDAIDSAGSNYGRAARALERFGISEIANLKTEGDRAEHITSASSATLEKALLTAKGVRLDWLRFWHRPLGLSDAEMLSIKEHITSGHPVSIGMMWPKELQVPDPVNCLLANCKTEDETSDGHCVALVGYEDNESQPGGGAFIIRNNWGTGWMQNGYARISYDYIRRFANDLIAFDYSPDAPHSLSPGNIPPSNVVETAGANLSAKDCRPVEDVKVVDDNIGRLRARVWLNNDQVLVYTDKRGQGITITVTAPDAGMYSLTVGATKAPNYGIYEFSIDGKKMGQPFDLSWPSVEPTGPVCLGKLTLKKGEHTLKVICVGKSLAATGYRLGLDWVSLKAE